jgi:hypothetical protein
MSTNMHVAPWNARNTTAGDCNRVSSMGLESDGGDGFVEFGWEQKGGNVYTGPNACADGNYFGSAHLFVAWQPDGGGYHCKELLIGLTADTYPNFSCKNPNLNFIFHCIEAGTDYYDPTVNFNRGVIFTNGERHNRTYDSAHARFEDMKFQLAGTTTWYATQAPYAGADTDPDYNWYKIANNDTKVDNNP